MFYTCSSLGSNSLPFYIPFWAEKLVPLLYAYNGIDNNYWYPFHIPSLEL